MTLSRSLYLVGAVAFMSACVEGGPSNLAPELAGPEPPLDSGPVEGQRAVAIDPEELELTSDSLELVKGVYRYRVAAGEAPTIEVGQYVFGAVPGRGELYLRRVTYSALEDGELTLGTVEAYWPEVLAGEALRVSVSPDASGPVPVGGMNASGGAAAEIPIAVGGDFAVDLCALGDVCNKDVSLFQCDQNVKGLQVCGLLKQAEISGSVTSSSNLKFFLEVDPGEIIPGEPAVYYPCSEYPASCLYTGVCIEGTEVVVSVVPFRTETCRKIKDAVPPQIIQPFIREIGVEGRETTVDADLLAQMSGNFRVEADIPLPKISLVVPIPDSTRLPYPLHHCKVQGEFVFGDFLHLESEFKNVGATLTGAASARFNAATRWGQHIGFSPTFQMLSEDVNAELAFEKPDTIRWQAGIIAKIGAAVRVGGITQPLCPIKLKPAIIEAFGGDVVEDVYTQPTPCATEFNEPVADGCLIDNYKHDIDFFGDFQFQAALTFALFGASLVDLDFFAENECKHIPPFQPGSCRGELLDLYGRGELEVVVDVSLDASGQPGDLDEDYQVTISRGIVNDQRDPRRLLWEPMADPASLTMDLSVASGSGSVRFSDHPEVNLLPVQPGDDVLFYRPLCRSRFHYRDQMVTRTDCTLAAGLDHMLKLEGVSANCYVENAVLDTSTDLSAERTFYRIIRLEHDGGAPRGQAQPNVETFEVVCSDEDIVFGSIEVTTVTTGIDLDPDGYDVRVKPCSEGQCLSTWVGSVGSNGSIVIDGLVAGERTVFLDGASREEQCMVVTTDPDLYANDATGLATVEVVPNETVALEFRVECGVRGAEDGAIHVSNATGGVDIDPDGYIVKVNGVHGGSFEANGDLEVNGLAPGTSNVELLDIAPNCSVDGDNPQEVSVVAGLTTNVHFDVTCVELPRLGGIEVTTASTGKDVPPAYTLAVAGSTASIGADTTLVVTVEEGSTEVALLHVAPNCSVAVPNPRTIEVVENDTTATTFQISCKQSNAASFAPIHGDIVIQDADQQGNQGKAKKRQVVTNQVLALALTGSLSGTGTMVRSYNLDENGTGQARGTFELAVSYNGAMGTVTGSFNGRVTEGVGAFSFTGQGAGGLERLKFQLDFNGPLESPWSYDGRALEPNDQGRAGGG